MLGRQIKILLSILNQILSYTPSVLLGPLAVKYARLYTIPVVLRTILYMSNMFGHMLLLRNEYVKNYY